MAALNPPAGSCVLDACAAPGMKTSQLAAAVAGDWVAALGGSPPAGAKVIAVERSTKRYQVNLSFWIHGLIIQDVSNKSFT